MQILDRRISLRALRSDYDLFHPTYFHPYFLRLLRTPFVVTVHDMIHHRFGSDKIRDDGTRQNLALICEKASRIIAVSEATKDDLCALMGVAESKVTVIYHGNSLSYERGDRLYPRKYLLYVGERDGYKNFPFFAASISSLLTKADLNLLCVGSREFSREERRSLESMGIGPRVQHLNVSTSSDLANLYHFAEVFCYPSLHEGFGIPLLEAFSCGCPVAASAIPSFREVAGDAVEYFDPANASSIRTVVEEIVCSPERARELVRKGAARARCFSWEEAARSTLEVYRSAL
jgi:glycosyltransferase involved in cell wall biosynthesis